jgi:hypothetical protein
VTIDWISVSTTLRVEVLETLFCPTTKHLTIIPSSIFKLQRSYSSSDTPLEFE